MIIGGYISAPDRSVEPKLHDEHEYLLVQPPAGPETVSAESCWQGCSGFDGRYDLLIDL